MADSRLVEFCLAIPEEQFRRNGESRWLIRRAMADKVPAEILANRRRGQQAANWLVTMSGSTSRIEQVLQRLERSSLATEALDLTRMREALQRIQNVRSDDPRAVMEYHAVLDSGLTMGSFLAWIEGVN
jgi:asparagine synthase (glutamine-hydrolysing)